MMTTTPFNALPICKDETDFRLNKDEFDFILNKTEYRDSKSFSGGVLLSKDTDVLRHEPMSRTKKFIIDKILDYRDNILQIEDDLGMTQSWSTINHKGNNHHEHNHPNTLISCVYYAQASSGDFVIKVPQSRIQEGFNFSYKIKEYNPFNSLSWTFEVKNGDVVIFPGWILHGTTRNESDIDRIVIGANYFINGTVGTEDGVDLIEI